MPRLLGRAVNRFERTCGRVAALVVLVALQGCGPEDKEPEARVLPVEGLAVQGLSLAPREGRCAALASFVAGFSAQHAAGVFRQVACSEQADGARTKLSFVFGDPGRAAAGSAVVILAGAGEQIVLCRAVTASATGGAATSCFGVGGGARGAGIPKDWRKDAWKLDDLIFSLQDFASR